MTFQGKKKIWVSLLCLFFCTIAIFSSHGLPRERKTNSTPKPAVERDVEIYFNNSTHSPAIQADLGEKIVKLIDSARSTVDLVVYELDLLSIAEALCRAKERGCTVRVILDHDSLERGQKVISLFEKNKIPWIDDTEGGNKGLKIMHNKFIVVDLATVLTGSTNFTQSCIYGDLVDGKLQGTGNRNHIIIIHSPDLAKIYTKQVEQMWGDGPGGKKDSKFKLKKIPHTIETVYTPRERIRIDVQFTPQHSKQFAGSALDNLQVFLRSAKKEIFFCQFVFSAQCISDELEKKHEERILLEGVGDREFFNRYYSEFLDMQGKVINDPQSNKQEVDQYTGHPNRPWKNPINTVFPARTGKNDKLHHKYWIVDGEKVFTGSTNTSGPASFENDENYVIIYSRTIAEQFKGEFQKRYEEAKGQK